jgi:hypothetical protein
MTVSVYSERKLNKSANRQESVAALSIQAA